MKTKRKATNGRLTAANLKMCFTRGLSSMTQMKSQEAGLAFGPWLRSMHVKGGANLTAKRLQRAHQAVEKAPEPRAIQKRLRLAGGHLKKAAACAKAAKLSLAHYFRALAALSSGWKPY